MRACLKSFFFRNHKSWRTVCFRAIMLLEKISCPAASGIMFRLIKWRITLKTLLKISLLVALATMMTGCLQMHMDTELKKDGSGTMEMTMSLSQVVSDVLAEGAGDDDLEDIGKIMQMSEKELKEKVKGHDIKIKKFSTDKIDGKESIHVVMEFKDLEGMSYAMSQIQGSGESEGGMAIMDLGNGQYALRPYSYNWPVTEEAEEEVIEEESMDDMDPEKMQKQMEMMGKLMGAMGELEFSMKITVPGDIITSNAPVVEGRTSIWTINSSNMMTAGGDMEPDIVFSSKGLKMKAIKE